jgi:hypothetical protein
MDAYATHQLVLLDVLGRIDKPILELGSGYYSTRQIHNAMEGRGIKVLTIDDNINWLSKYRDLENDWHGLTIMSDKDFEKFCWMDDTEYGLVFIDGTTWDSRTTATMRYKETADYVIIHDSYYPAEMGYFGSVIFSIGTSYFAKRDFRDVFKWWVEYYPENSIVTDPSTLLGSNKIDVSGIEIKGMVISNKSE